MTVAVSGQVEIDVYVNVNDAIVIAQNSGGPKPDLIVVLPQNIDALVSALIAAKSEAEESTRL